jgi:phage shock protein E
MVNIAGLLPKNIKLKMKDLINKGTVVDVRSPQEFAGEHFPNAINIPLDQVPQKVNEFKEMPKPIIAYCRSGNRSGMAVSMLKQAGITDAINGGGLDDLLLKVK